MVHNGSSRPWGRLRGGEQWVETLGRNLAVERDAKCILFSEWQEKPSVPAVRRHLGAYKTSHWGGNKIRRILRRPHVVTPG